MREDKVNMNEVWLALPDQVKALYAVTDVLWEDALLQPSASQDGSDLLGPPPGLLVIPGFRGCDNDQCCVSSGGTAGLSTNLPSMSGDALASALNCPDAWSDRFSGLASKDFRKDDCDSLCSGSALSDDGSIDILVGPTDMAASQRRLTELWLPSRMPGSGGTTAVPIRSGPGCLSLGDVLRLSEARSIKAPLSFGSTMHLITDRVSNCRPCMFERWPGRCRKSWLCDFCHAHTGRGKPVNPSRRVGTSISATRTWSEGSQ